MPEFSVIGKRVPRVDALSKVTGAAIYSADVALPRMLHGKIYRSPYAHARIVSLDVSKAKKLDGVKAVITADDVPGYKTKGMYFASGLPHLAREKVVYEGQPVAVVAAASVHIAEEALSLIGAEYEELPPVTNIEDGMKQDAPIIHAALPPNPMRPQQGTGKPGNVFFRLIMNRGDIESGFKDADYIYENTYRTQKIHHGYIEPMAAVADIGIDGRISVWTQSQGTFRVRQAIADFLNIPLSRINVNPVEIGGAFGGKNYQPVSPLCALLAMKTGRPVRMELTRSEVIKDSRPAPESLVEIKMGVTRQGKITATSARVVFDGGAFPEITHGMFTRENAFAQYKIPNLKIEAIDVLTNKVPSGFYRSPGVTQVAFAIESHIDAISKELGIDPLQLRIRNVAEKGDIDLAGEELPRVGFRETLEKMAEYLNKKDKPEGKNRGRGISCGAWHGAAGSFGAIVNLNGDATVNLVVGVTDISGSVTAIAQIVAEEFCVPLKSVKIIVGDTDTAPWASISVGSMVLYSLSMAAFQACQDAKKQLAGLAAMELGVKPSEIEFYKGSFQVKGDPQKSISWADIVRATISFRGGGPVLGRGSIGGLPPAPMMSVHAADVEVDVETGKVKIIDYAIAEDVGLAVNPMAVEGQLQGAVVQGIGWALSEGYVFNKGVVQNPSLLDYRIPTALDVPMIAALAVEVNSELGLHGLKQAAEAPIIPGPGAVANAIHSATGIRMTELPMTPEAVFRAIKTQEKSAR